jgi:hypothetical protein
MHPTANLVGRFTRKIKGSVAKMMMPEVQAHSVIPPLRRCARRHIGRWRCALALQLGALFL